MRRHCHRSLKYYLQDKLLSYSTFLVVGTMMDREEKYNLKIQTNPEEYVWEDGTITFEKR